MSWVLVPAPHFEYAIVECAQRPCICDLETARVKVNQCDVQLIQRFDRNRLGCDYVDKPAYRAASSVYLVVADYIFMDFGGLASCIPAVGLTVCQSPIDRF